MPENTQVGGLIKPFIAWMGYGSSISSGSPLKEETVIHFERTATIVSTAAGTAVPLIRDAEVPVGFVPYVTGFSVAVNGSTAWSGGSFTALGLTDTNGTPVSFASVAVAALTSNANVFPHSSNVTLGAAFRLQSGGTAGKGLQAKGDANAGAGSDVVVTVRGYYRRVLNPA